MRRYVYAILILAVLVVPFALRRGVRATGTANGSAARRLVVVTANNQDIRNEFASAFQAWHSARFGQAVEIDYRTPGGSSDIKRLLQSTYGRYLGIQPLPPDATSGIDVAWGGGDFFFGQLKGMGILAPLDLPPGLLQQAFPSPTLAGVKLYDDDKDAAGHALAPRWVGTCLSSFGIVYNPDLYDHALHLPPPATWADLARPELAGWVALADPTHSGSAAVAYMMVVQRAMADAEEAAFALAPALRSLSKEARFKAYVKSPSTVAVTAGEKALADDYRAAIADGWRRGMGQLVLIAANARYFSDSATLPPQDVANGEAAAGTAIDFYGRVYEQSAGRDRCRVVMPRAATAITPDPVAVLWGAPDRELANRFVEFLLTPAAQRLWDLKAGTPGGPRDRSLRRLPARRDVYADRTNWADDLNPFEEAGGFNQRAEWMALFNDMIPLWGAAWIDSRDDLKRAYTAVLAVRDPARQAALLADLARFPLSMADVADYAAQRSRREKANDDAAAWKAAQRIDWARRCREHYQRVEQAARAW